MKIFQRMLIVLALSLFSNEVGALTIVTPTDGQVVYQGDYVKVVVKADAGKDWQEIRFGLTRMA